MVFTFGFRPVPLCFGDRRHYYMSFREFWVEFQRLPGCQFSPRTLLFCDSAHKNGAQIRVGVRQPQITGGVCRVLSDRLIEIRDALLQIGFVIAPVQSELALQIVFVDFRRDGADSCEPLVFLPRNSDLNLARNGLRHVRIHGKHVAQFAVIRLRPEMLIACRSDQLSMNSNPTAVSHHRALNNCVNPKLFGNFRGGELRTFKTNYRCWGNHAKMADVGKPPNEFLSYSVREVLLCRVTREIL